MAKEVFVNSSLVMAATDQDLQPSMRKKDPQKVVAELSDLIEVLTSRVDKKLSETVIDCHFFKTEVLVEEKDQSEEDLKGLLGEVFKEHPALKIKTSHLDMEKIIGDRDLALRLFALGHYLELWEMTTPEDLGFLSSERDQIAAAGYLSVDDYKF